MIFDDVSQNLIFAVKHGDRLDLAPFVVSWLYAAGGALIANADVVIPVSMHPGRLLRRRYNQSAVLAHGLDAGADIGVFATAFRRSRHMPTRRRLGRKAREKNLRRMIPPAETARQKLRG